MKPLHDLIAGSEEWLMQRILTYARENGYTAYTSTLAEAWRASIVGLSAPIVQALAAGESLQPLHADRDFISDPIARFGVAEARKHRERGVSFPLFMGLMKYYRRAYIDLIMEAGYPASHALASRDLMDNFFDRIELAFSDEWLKLKQAALIHELQQANVQITNEKNKFLTIFESLPNPVLFLDAEDKVANINRAAAALFYDKAVPGSHYYGDDQTLLPRALEEEFREFSLRQGRNFLSEKEIKAPKGPGQFMIMMQRMLDISGKYNGTVVILSDVTHLKRLEEEIELLNTDLSEHAFQLEQANQGLEAFNYSVSHDLRTPLTGISGYCQLLLGQCAEAMDDQCTAYVKEILATCNRMNQFISAMLDFSRLSNSQINRRKVDISAIAERVGANLRLGEADGRVEFSVAPGIEVTGDPRLLGVVMENLLGNAWKFSAGTATPMVEFASVERGDETVYYVKDNGIGFDMKDAARLFTPFQRLHEAHFGGFGVGLASVERIIHMHGGRVWAESVPGGGATFFFTLGKDR